MSLIYKSRRVGKGGHVFNMLKFRTLKEGSDRVTSYADNQTYTRFGWFLRRFKLDELPQLINVLKGDMALFGYRPEEVKTFNSLPQNMRHILIKVKPGIIDLASLYFIDEEFILQKAHDKHFIYWEYIKPMKFVLQCFYIENRSWLLNLAILWSFFKKIIK